MKTVCEDLRNAIVFLSLFISYLQFILSYSLKICVQILGTCCSSNAITSLPFSFFFTCRCLNFIIPIFGHLLIFSIDFVNICDGWGFDCMCPEKLNCCGLHNMLRLSHIHILIFVLSIVLVSNSAKRRDRKYNSVLSKKEKWRVENLALEYYTLK